MMFVERVGEDTWIRQMPAWVVDTLIRLPDLLESQDPEVKKRLQPAAYTDPEAEQEWRQHITPDLEHLFQTRTEIIRKDLAAMQIDLRPGEDEEADEDDADFDIDFASTFTLQIPGKHLSAWLTSLQAGTHAVFLVEDLTEEDIGRDPRDESDGNKQMAMMRLLIMQELLAMLCGE
jgi:hypothetical protein